MSRIVGDTGVEPMESAARMKNSAWNRPLTASRGGLYTSHDGQRPECNP